jgi:predicted dehydrogenase
MALRFGVLGTGHWAQEAHATALAASDDAEFVGVWGRNPAKAQAVAERFGVRGFADLDELLGAVDAVAVALPPDVQADLAVRAAAAGCHLLLDKPLALSVESARRVVDAVAAGGVASVIFFTSRFRPEVAAWLDEVAGGDWHGGHGTWLGSIYHQGSPYADSAWRQRKGGLWDVGPHALSLAIPLLGPVERVTAANGLGDTVHLVLGHRGGASSTLSLSLTVPVAAATTGFTVYGPRGMTTMPPGDTTVVAAFGEAVRQLRAEVDSGERSHPCGVGFGAEVVAVLAAAERFLAAPLDTRTEEVAGSGRAADAADALAQPPTTEERGPA